MRRAISDNLVPIIGWLLLVVNIAVAAYLGEAHRRLNRLTNEFIEAKQHFERWQKTADHMLQENGYEPITPLLADK